MKVIAILLLASCLSACIAKKEEIPVGIFVGNIAPDFTSKTPNDSIISLSEQRGKLLLLDFWASWCPPCRIENKQLIKTVEHFSKSKFPGRKRKPTVGLHVFNISFDSNKENWIKAIKQDKLNWVLHGSDLKGWGDSVGKKYQINTIPSNLLINAKGIVIARNLRGEKLDLFLENYKIKED